MATKYLDMIRDAVVTPEMLEEVAIASDDYMKQMGGKSEPDTSLWVTFRTFKDRKLSPHTLTAIMLRMEALGDLVAAGRIKEWQLPGTGPLGEVSIDAVLFAAAAQAKLLLSNRRGSKPTFDLEEFKRLALIASEPQGLA